MYDKHIHTKIYTNTSKHDRCIGVHVPGIADIINMYTSTGQLPPTVKVMPHVTNDKDETFETDISYRDMRHSDIAEQFNNIQAVGRAFLNDAKRLSKENSKPSESPKPNE